MCGIAGIFHFESTRKVNAETLQRMNDTNVQRGPDEEG